MEGSGAGKLLGLAACLVSSISFGSMFVPVRKFPAGDGIFVQWCVCSAVYIVGIFTYFGTNLPPFQPLAMLGGALWALGNLTSIPIINRIGIGAGQLIWGVAVCVVGWATGRFGLFGTHASVPGSPVMNYLGVALVIVGGVLLSFVKKSESPTYPNSQPPNSVVENDEAETDISPTADPTTSNNVGMDVETGGGRGEEATSLVGVENGAIEMAGGDRVPSRKPSSLAAAAPKTITVKDRLIAVAMAIFAGTCYGSMFTPVIYIQDNPKEFKNPSKDAIDYVHSHFTGIYLTSTIAFLIYVALKGNRPYVNQQIILPSFFCGLLWAVGMLSWFPANDYLSQAITVPINAMLPGCIAASWSVFYFREITGAKNLKLLSIAILVTVTGVTLVALSKFI